MKISKAFLKFLISISICLIILPNSNFAATTGRITGIVTDATTGESLIGANIYIKSEIKNGREIPLDNMQGAATDMDGYFSIINVRPGKYVIECSYMGYQKVVQTGVEVFVNTTTDLDFNLLEESIQGEEVVVIAKTPPVRRDLTSSSSKIGGEALKNLPVESFSEVLALQPGVTVGANGGLHIRGGRTSEVKYYVDGMAVSNPFDNSLAVPVENNAIQEVEVISGTFNAEYGQAQSGVVNIVTKEGTERISGSASAYFGEYYSSNDDVFMNIDDIDPFQQKYFEADISGPVFTNKLKFFVSGRYTSLENQFYGKRTYSTMDSSSFAEVNPDEWYVESTGDDEYVPMNSSENYSGNFKLTWNVIPELKVAYTLTGNRREFQNYNGTSGNLGGAARNYRYNPDALATYHNNSINHLLAFTHTLNSNMFYTLRFSKFDTDNKRYVYEDPYDIRYVADYLRNRQPQNVFSTGGVDASHQYRKSSTYTGKLEFNMLLGKYNFVKIGAEYREHDLDFHYFAVDVDPNQYGNYDRVLPPITSVDNNAYNKKPVEIALYIQDKIEIKSLTVNVGLRYDYFDPKSVVPNDLRDPGNKFFPKPYAEAYTEVEAKTQISPRIGLAFPITTRGVVHAAYGQFFQIPEFNRLYQNPEFEVVNNSFIGNADLEAQRTDMYEIGLQQQLSDFLAIDITGYYRNVRNLLGSDINQTYRGDIYYGRYVNNSHGSVKGFSISAKVDVPESGLVADINYTHMEAKGIASDPQQTFRDLSGNTEAAIVLNPLDWDLRNNFNFTFSYMKPSWGISVIGRMNSGYPFTPTNSNSGNDLTELRNQGRYQGEINIDLHVFKRFPIGDVNLEIFARVINVFDRQRIELFPQIRPEDEQTHEDGGFARFNTLYEYNLNAYDQPSPREIRFGVRLFY